MELKPPSVIAVYQEDIKCVVVIQHQSVEYSVAKIEMEIDLTLPQQKLEFFTIQIL